MKHIKHFAVFGLLIVAVLFIVGMAALSAQSPELAMTGTLLSAAFGTVMIGNSNMKIFDWSKAKDFGSMKEFKEDIAKTFNHFIRKMAKQPVQGKPLMGEKFTGADSTLSGTPPVVLVHSDQPAMPDRGYELLFELVNMLNSTSKSFEILDVSGGVTFYQQLEGEEAKLSKIPSSAKTPCNFLRFTGGFPILDDWLRFNEYYKIDDLAADTMRNWYKKKATIMYGLLTALTGIDQAFDTDDATTINKACATILNDLEAAGYAVDESASFVITCNPMLRARILKALKSSYLNPGNNTNEIEFTISGVISTSKYTDTTKYDVSLPGYKNRRGEWEDLNTRPPQRNELKLGADHVWTGAYNGIIGEKKQHRRCATS